ncbi:cryptochrome/photolyase family protein [Dyella sp. 2RAB6]|uniref:cryptochrome/photolyase family protein n=1 Tax=Dyella sp. 2RAB6 TaxID=3232992 RepID=UPI003F92CEEA
MTALVWFRRDLRLADNPALAAACAEHERILPVYVHGPDEEGAWAGGAASRWWLHHSLAALSAALERDGGDLHIRAGDTLGNLVAACRAVGATAVYWNRCYEPALIERDKRLKTALREQGIEPKSFNAGLWVEPWQVATKQNGPYRVFTPFWRAVRPRLTPDEPLPVPAMRFASAQGKVSLASLELLPRIRWDGGLHEAWRPGEQGALEALELFADDALNGYARLRDLPARHGTSRLSPHLHFGEISPRQIHHILHRQTQGRDAKRRPDLEPFLRELGWREFAHHLLFHFPQTPSENFNPGFANFRWADTDDALLERWRHGRTGIPLVDAGMRELWHTGWMHNRVRMVVASFLAKNLRQHWHHGARWFWDTLVDADLANNTLGWQWVAGCGADAAPYFRVFNPVAQAQKFDPQGDYLRRWLPELKDAPLPLLHEPWKDASLLSRSGYPAPMLDLADSRNAALAAYQAMRGRG